MRKEIRPDESGITEEEDVEIVIDYFYDPGPGEKQCGLNIFFIDEMED